MNYIERDFQLNGIKLATKHWGHDAHTPVLAIHGWMDNAASFDILAPMLDDCQIVAVDTAGHGRSDHFPPGQVYNIWSDVADLFSLADQLGWDQFSIIGHSRGANVGILMAGTFPERIKSLVLLDGGYPQTVSADQIPTTLAKSVTDKQKQPSLKSRRASNRDAAIALRVNGSLPISAELTELLAVRGLSNDNGEFFWHADQKLKSTSELRLTPEILNAFYNQILTPVLGIFAADGFAELLLKTPMRKQIENFRSITLPGGHHFHMAGSVTVIGDEIKNFYRKHLLEFTR